MKAQLKSAALRAHKFAGSFGLHVLPRHFYSPFADLAELKQTRSEWAKPSMMPGIDMDLDRQLEFVSHLKIFLSEKESVESYRQAVEEKVGLGYGLIEAKFLYAMLRCLRPRRIVEVGGGISSAVIQAAIRKNRSYTNHYVIEPYPSPALLKLTNGTAIAKRAQQCPEYFDSLEAGDVLFIDSSHTVKPGSDVIFLILEVLPRLKPGVIIHLHDIFFPYAYQIDLLQTLFQWSETAMLQAYLAHNAKCEVLYALSDLHHRAPEELQYLVPEFNPVKSENGLLSGSRTKLKGDEEHFPCSIYLRTK